MSVANFPASEGNKDKIDVVVHFLLSVSTASVVVGIRGIDESWLGACMMRDLSANKSCCLQQQTDNERNKRDRSYGCSTLSTDHH